MTLVTCQRSFHGPAVQSGYRGAFTRPPKPSLGSRPCSHSISWPLRGSRHWTGFGGSKPEHYCRARAEEGDARIVAALRESQRLVEDARKHADKAWLAAEKVRKDALTYTMYIFFLWVLLLVFLSTVRVVKYDPEQLATYPTVQPTEPVMPQTAPPPPPPPPPPPAAVPKASPAPEIMAELDRLDDGDLMAEVQSLLWRWDAVMTSAVGPNHSVVGLRDVAETSLYLDMKQMATRMADQGQHFDRVPGRKQVWFLHEIGGTGTLKAKVKWDSTLQHYQDGVAVTPRRQVEHVSTYIIVRGPDGRLRVADKW